MGALCSLFQILDDLCVQRYYTNIQDDVHRAQHLLDMEQSHETAYYKLLLLGTGHVGKSTIWKQLLDIYDTEEKKIDAKNIYDSILKSFCNFLNENVDATDYTHAVLKQKVNNDRVFDTVEYFLSNCNNIIEFDQVVASKITTIWHHEFFVNAWKNRRNIGSTESLEYFIDNLDRIAADNYIASKQDDILSATATTGIAEREMVINNVAFKVYDTGGQRSERSKWIHAFECVDVVLFVASLNHFDQILYEDENINAMEEQLNLFQCVLCSKYLRNSKYILLLTGTDLLKRKIIDNKQRIYKMEEAVNSGNIMDGGENDEDYYQECVQFITNEFKAIYNMNSDDIDVYTLNASNKEEIENTFDVIADSVKSTISVKQNVLLDNDKWSVMYRNHEGIERRAMVQHFCIVFLVIFALALLLVFVPYDIMSYIVFGVAILYCLAVLSNCGDGCNTALIWTVSVISLLWMVFACIQIVFIQTTPESDYDSNWNLVLYLLAPIVILIGYNCLVVTWAIYYYKYLMWSLVWMGLALLTSGLALNITVVWVVGIGLMCLVLIVPFLTYAYFKCIPYR